jgi:glycosyltransferase involved in cell wall biosynthesis
MRQKKTLDVSIVMPAYRQEKFVVQNLTSLEKVLKKMGADYEIICVVDGHGDKTYKNAQKIKSNHLVLLGYPDNQGKGYAVRYGMSKAKGNIIGFVDSGGIDYSMLPMMYQHFLWYDADVVIGSKRHPASEIIYPWYRSLVSFGYQVGVKLLFGLNVRDTQVGMKLFKRKVVLKILPKLLVKQFAFDIEMLSLANYFGFTKIFEVPVKIKYDFRGASVLMSKGFLKMAFNMAWDTLAIWYRLYLRHYYV